MDGSVAVRRKKSLAAKIWEHRYLYLLLLPGLSMLIVFDYFPLYGIQLAFKQFKFNLGIWESPWVGFANFQLMFRNPQFVRAFWNSIIISFGKLFTGFPVPIILVLLFNELKNQKFRRISQTILYLPHFLSWIIIAGLIYNMFNVTNGVYGKLFRELTGTTAPSILINPSHFRAQLYISSIWKGAGWSMIIYLAAVAGIDPGLYESARLDGANRFQMAMYITLPMLAFAVAINLILSMGGILSAGFDQILNLYSPQTYSTGDVIDTFVYRFGITQGKFDIGAAVGLFKNVIGCALVLIANKIAGWLGGHNLF